jgi:Glycoside-hydrolase family GH114
MMSMKRVWLAFAALALPIAMTTSGAAASAAEQAGAGTASRIQAPVASGMLAITGTLRDGTTVAASGLSWRPGRLPAGDKLLSFEVGYAWQACSGSHCVAGADSTVTPFAARHYVAGHADTGRKLRVTVTATEVVQTDPADFAFSVIHATRSFTSASAVAAYPAGKPPVSQFINGLPERTTGSDEEYFQVSAAHYSSADGPVKQQYRIDDGAWRAVPSRRVFYTGKLAVGPHRVSVLTSDRAGHTSITFGWRVVPLPAPLACKGSCWYPPHLNSAGHPMRWDWQIGRVTPLQRTGDRAVDIYDLDGFLTTRAEVHAIHTTWQASTLPHPKAICYLDLAWEDYRPDASPAPRGMFPAATLGKVYFGYPQERWVDFRQLNQLKPMLTERVAMCARKGFDAVELDDIEVSPPSTTGFFLSAGDAQNYLAYAFNLVHSYGMTVLWKNAPGLARWGVKYTDGAIIEECYLYRECGSWHVFTQDKTALQPTGKWVGEAEYGSDHYVCNPGQTGPTCSGRRSFAAYCRTVYDGPNGYAAVKFDVDLDGRVFYPCPDGT